MQTAFETQVSNTLIYLERHQPFWSYLTYQLQISPDPQAVSACINSRGLLRICPAFFERLSVQKKAFLIAHETAHLALGLWWRSTHHDQRKANFAHDHVVNLLLTEDGKKLDWFIEGGLMDVKLVNLSYEEVYHRLPDPPEEWICDADLSDRPATSGADETRESVSRLIDLRDSWTDRTAAALEVARLKGNLPAKLEEAVLELLQPKVPWAHKLLMTVKEGRRRPRLSYGKISRRGQMFSDDFVFPAEISRGTNLAVAIDTSASVTSTELQRAVSEGAGILKVLSGKIRYLACDAQIHIDAMTMNPRALRITGRGGTSFIPVFDALKKSKINTLIYFTDLAGDFPNYVQPFKVIWAVYEQSLGGIKPPFGQVLTVSV